MSQGKYANDILRRLDMERNKVMNTPLSGGRRMILHGK